MSQHPSELLGADDPPAYCVEHESGRSPLLFTCDHAGNRLPLGLGDLGLPEAELERHIAWDLGCAALSRRLARRLDAFLITQTYSRLVIDVNRPPGTPESIVTLSDGTRIPGNEGLREHERQARVRRSSTPTTTHLRAELDRRRSTGQPSMLVAMHSFTPLFMGVSRPLARRRALRARYATRRSAAQRPARDPTLVVGDNEPYSVSDDTDYTLVVHGEQRGIPHVELEIRQDLLADERDKPSGRARLAARSRTSQPPHFRRDSCARRIALSGLARAMRAQRQGMQIDPSRLRACLSVPAADADDPHAERPLQPRLRPASAPITCGSRPRCRSQAIATRSATGAHASWRRRARYA